MSNSEPTSIYFVGIGGIGMSALARYFNARGASVTGYDLTETDLTRALEAEGISVHYQADVEAIPMAIDLAVYTPAIPDDFEELVVLRERGVRLVKRAEALGVISRQHRTLGVAGTHGKTTTSTIAAYLMRESGTDCVAFLGGVSANYGTNYLAGKGEWLVAEADEYDRSFLQLYPEVTIVTYVEPDHLDIYGDKDSFEASFESYLKQVKPGGTVITKPHIAERFAEVLKSVQVITYSLAESADYTVADIRVETGQFVFTLHAPQGTFYNVRIGIPGRHNIENALAALAAVVATGQPLVQLLPMLGTFRGIARRFEVLGKWNDATVISDYAHHPTEVSACISAVKELYRGYRIIGIFQPHLYTRTRDFAKEFGEALSNLEEIILVELYPAREKPINGVSSSTIYSNISKNKKYLANIVEVTEVLNVINGDILLFMGAGSIDTFARRLVEAQPS